MILCITLSVLGVDNCCKECRVELSLVMLNVFSDEERDLLLMYLTEDVCNAKVSPTLVKFEEETLVIFWIVVLLTDASPVVELKLFSVDELDADVGTESGRGEVVSLTAIETICDNFCVIDPDGSESSELTTRDKVETGVNV